MKDIDFEELDRAVSSLMGSVPEGDDKEESDEPVVVTPGSSVQPPVEVNPPLVEAQAESLETTEVLPVDEPQSAESEPAAVEGYTPTHKPEPSLTPPASRGRFMDVKPTGGRDSARPAPSRPISRQAVALQPISTEVEPETVSDQMDESEPAVEASSSTDQPDQISFQPEADTSNKMEDYELINLAKDQAEPITDEALQVPTEDESGDTAPLDSPFLPGAKVEKRPLGRPAEEAAPVVDLASELATGSGDPSPVNELAQEGSDDVSPDRDAQLPEQPLPPELSSDVLSIETDSGTVSELAASSAVPIREASKPQPGTQPTAQPAPRITARPATPVSIPQQYKVEPKKNEELQSTNAIYDAQPLSHPARKTPGWVWVVAIALIIILGVAGGVAVYYLGMN